MDKADKGTINNIACLFCPYKLTCDQFNKLLDHRIERGARHIQSIYQRRFDPKGLKNTIDQVAAYERWPKNKTLCYLGILLTDGYIECGSREKRGLRGTYDTTYFSFCSYHLHCYLVHKQPQE